MAGAGERNLELPAITPGLLGQYLVGLGGSPTSRRKGCRSKMFNTWPVMPSRERPGFTTGGGRR